MIDAPDVLRRAQVIERMMAEANKRAGTYRGPCGTCRWHNMWSGGTAGRCENPVVLAQSLSIRGHAAAKYIRWCSTQRDVSSTWGEPICGPDGFLWEQGGIIAGIKRMFGIAP